MARVHELHGRREELEDQLRYYQGRFKEVSKQLEERAAPNPSGNGHGGAELAELDAERVRIKRTVERIRGQMRAIDAEVVGLEQTIDACFHPYWGSLMKETDDRSSFGDQVEEYACLYTSRVSNFAAYSPLQHFRSGRDRMPHEHF
jgi:chaperonin cofactor prefoldin